MDEPKIRPIGPISAALDRVVRLPIEVRIRADDCKGVSLKRTVKSYDPASGFTFVLPLPVAPSAGDTISMFAGCDKTLATCRAKFNNAGRFRGYPWVPNPETAAPPVPGFTKSGK